MCQELWRVYHGETAQKIVIMNILNCRMNDCALRECTGNLWYHHNVTPSPHGGAGVRQIREVQVVLLHARCIDWECFMVSLPSRTAEMIDCLQCTKQYYADWLDADADAMDRKGIVLIETNKRKICPRGYPRNLELFSVATSEGLFVSFSPDLGNKVHVRDGFNAITAVEAGIAILKEIFKEKLCQHKTYYFTELPDNIDTAEVVCLKKDDYPAYLSFFIKQNPDASPEGWLEGYFTKLADNRRCYGIFRDRALVCATGAPDVPFMDGVITELGVDTLAGFRGKGYAQAVCAEYIKNALSRNEAPIWTCWHNNIASSLLAERLGYQWFSDLYTVEGDVPYSSD